MSKATPYVWYVVHHAFMLKSKTELHNIRLNVPAVDCSQGPQPPNAFVITGISKAHKLVTRCHNYADITFGHLKLVQCLIEPLIIDKALIFHFDQQRVCEEEVHSEQRLSNICKRERPKETALPEVMRTHLETAKRNATKH
ncbi:hypothetical protein T11_10454 [Trichinella zimbabwensis]|uniref:Uncharacterized protein n=1 Tax=Trichinella zimbabwensis TaxID=268475 RepID=A0A0V1GXA8_9BILA|nr:hypothetical protein T11_10454 [Trichinella zimbabwensis]